MKIFFDNFGITPKGIDSIKTSASFDMDSISLGSAPISLANFSTPAFPFELAMLTLYPALTNFLANVPPIFPVPIILTLIFI